MAQDSGHGDGPRHAAVTRETVPDLPDCPGDLRDLMAGLPFHEGLHAALRDGLPLFHRVERGPAPAQGSPPPKCLRIGAWNLERNYHPGAAAAVLAREGVDVALVTEVDVGMVRTGQRHTPRVMAEALGHQCLYGVEFLELSLGSAREERLFAGQTNARGFHGNGILSAWPLEDPVLIRFDPLATWFPVDYDERRVGGRFALAGKLPVGDQVLVVVCVHTEIRMPASQRAEQMGTLLRALDAYAAGAPVLMGGDFNTDGDAWSLSRAERDLAIGSEAWARINARTLDPVAHEPLFQVAADFGYGWEAANTKGRTTRETPQSGPRRYPDLRLDWFFTRGVTAQNPRVLPAVGEDGTVLSDHDLITLDVVLPD